MQGPPSVAHIMFGWPGFGKAALEVCAEEQWVVAKTSTATGGIQDVAFGRGLGDEDAPAVCARCGVDGEMGGAARSSYQGSCP